MRLRLSLLLLAVAGLALVLSRSGPAAEGDSGNDEQTIRAANLTPDGPALLDFFKKRSQENVEPSRLAELVKQLGDKSGEVADRAAGELISLGPVAIPLLRQAVKDPDEPMIAGRARRCLLYIEGSQAAAVPVAAARLLAQRRPDGAAEALLAYLPCADDEVVVEEVKAALAAVAVRDGKPDPVLVRALQDPNSLRRATAA